MTDSEDIDRNERGSGKRKLRSVALLLVSLHLSCAGADARNPSSGPPPAPKVQYREGIHPPSHLMRVHEDGAYAQQFVADGARLHDLSLLVSRHGEGTAPLIVEVRNTELTRRFGLGAIEPFAAEPALPSWHSVNWRVPPTLEPGETYALVFLSDDADGSWGLALGGRGLYPFGDFYAGTNHRLYDLAFRATYQSGAVTESELTAPETPLDNIRVGKSSASAAAYGLRAHPYGMRPSDRIESYHLPQCVPQDPERGPDRCTDFYDTVRGTPAERARLASQTFQACSTPPRTKVGMMRPVVGLTCRDVCAGLGFAGCEGLISGAHLCSAHPHLQQRQRSCDRVVSAAGVPRQVGCACTNEADDSTAELGGPPVHSLFSVSSSVARTQTFAADGTSFAQVEFMLQPGDGPLLVEVRSPDLLRRYGMGHVPADDGAFGWRSVSWDDPPSLTLDDTYAFVLRGEAATQNDWGVAASEADVYPWGSGPDFTYRIPGAGCGVQKDGMTVCLGSLVTGAVAGIDLAFRVQYSDGAQTSIPLRPTTPAPDFKTIPVRNEWVGWPHINESGPALPMCVGASCADPTENLLGSVDARHARARQNFQQCSPNETFVRMKSPTAGLSCQDVCRGFGFEGCRLQVRNEVAQCSANAFSEVQSCATIIGGRRLHKPQTSCECAVEKGSEVDPKKVKRSYPTFPKWMVGPSGTFVRKKASKVTILKPGADPVTRTFDLPGKYSSPEVIGKWFLFEETLGERRAVMAVTLDGSKKFEVRFPRCDRVYAVRYRDQPWAACFLDDVVMFRNVITNARLDPPPEPESHRLAPPIGVGDRFYFLGRTHLWSWEPGEAAWTNRGDPATLRTPSPALGKLLEEIQRVDPTFPGFVGGTYYGDDGWAYDTKAHQFLHSDIQVGSFDRETNERVVRYGNHLLDTHSGEFRRAPVPKKTSWSGRTALFEAGFCPHRRTCTPLPAPFSDLVTLEFDPADLPSEGAIVMEPLRF